MISAQLELGHMEIVVVGKDGELHDRVLQVQSVVLESDDVTHEVEFDELTEWEEAPNRAMQLLTEQRLTEQQEDDVLPSITANQELRVSEDTKSFNATLVIAYIQPTTTSTVGEVLGYDKPGNAVKSAKSTGLVQPVAKDGTAYYYAVTEKGWKEIVSMYGPDKWQHEAEELLVEYVSDIENEDEADFGLKGFSGYSEDNG